MIKKRYLGYLFDLDGTLVDTVPDLQVALNRSLCEFGYTEVDADLTRLWVGHGGRTMLSQAIAHQTEEILAPEKLEQMYQAFIDAYSSQTSDLSAPYQGVIEALATLYQRACRLGVVTNKQAYTAIKLLDELDLTKYFNIVVGGDSLQVAKPYAEPALYALNELEVNPKDALFVGDSETDVKCARNAQCDVVLVKYGYNGGRDPSSLGADSVIDSFDELI